MQVVDLPSLCWAAAAANGVGVSNLGDQAGRWLADFDAALQRGDIDAAVVE
jgi:hypothetical protein